MSIWITVALAWVAAMLLVVAVARMAARGDVRRDRHGTFSVDELGKRTAREAASLPVHKIPSPEEEPVDPQGRGRSAGSAGQRPERTLSQ